MKSKTSITLSEDLIVSIDSLIGPGGNRSAFIEAALRKAVSAFEREQRNKRDIGIINRNAGRLNREAEDALSYQADI